MALTLLTDQQVTEYISGLDLSQNSEAGRTLNALLLLPKESFTEAVSALAQGLITFANIRTLPAVNPTLLKNLITTKLGASDQTTLAWRYRTEWLPASINVATVRSEAISSATSYLSERFFDRWSLIIQPQYDFYKTDETKFHSYIEAYSAYMICATSQRATAIVDAFRSYHSAFKAAHPVFFNLTNAEDPVLQLVESLQTDALFLEKSAKIKSDNRTLEDIFSYTLSGLYRRTTPGEFDRYMSEVAYPSMAASTDPLRSGLPAVKSLATSTVWPKISMTGTGWKLANARVAKIHLPKAYGTQALTSAQLAANIAENDALTRYFETARTAIIDFQKEITLQMSQSAAIFRATAGSCIGLTLCITNA